MMNFKDLYYFIGKCLVIDDNPGVRAEIVSSISHPDFPWEDFVRLSSSQKVVPALYARFRSSELIRDLPQDMVQYLEYFYGLNLKRNLSISKQVYELSSLLVENEIFPIFLKGSANLVDKLYPDSGERMIGDIDFLVREEDFFNTAEVLQSIGYRPHIQVKTKNYSKIKHYPSMIKDGVPSYVEIHRLVENYPHSKRLTSSMVWDDKIPSAVIDSCFVPSREHRIIHNFLHAQINNNYHYYGQVSLKDYHDIYLLTKDVDVDSLMRNFPFYRKKLETYLSAVSQTFNKPDHLPFIDDLHYKRFMNRANKNLQGSFGAKVNYQLRFIINRIWTGAGALVGFISNRGLRARTIHKLQSRTAIKKNQKNNKRAEPKR